jgi:hypothetical protein
MTRQVGKAMVLIALAFFISTGCMGRVRVTSRGPAKTDVFGVTVEFDSSLGQPNESIVTGLAERSATVMYGGITADIDDMNLTVNGRRYGAVKKGDHIFIDKESVAVNGEARAVADK